MRDEMNHMIADVNRNTERDISLINDRIQELKAVIADADRHVAAAKSEAASRSRSVEFQEKITEAVQMQTGPSTPAQRAASQYRRTAELTPPVPVANIPTVVIAPEPVVPKKDITGLVHELAAAGDSVEEIARKLERSITEVQFALDMGV